MKRIVHINAHDLCFRSIGIFTEQDLEGYSAYLFIDILSAEIYPYQAIVDLDKSTPCIQVDICKKEMSVIIGCRGKVSKHYISTG